ncbi:16S rRNA (guanine(966)-N(2))-methyltransferase RsmD [Campylobacter sp. VicNov18]|uniref:16S rRNA (guanine(966)-N(2))-methyltransferase RsmD n=1 Tax=Campylobacter bilis TaxID=2691918 RepID=UPI00130E017F|nr:16S rRNA (guanine(966)-N(2))-methyltransferase RsmD [Campylobacter bilis]MPV63974.1 16S rRNA (guanine(966)-N(2))-methyltransferase RsmD [Campylobacter hepaticus]MBM0637475.1 16S rRNA (guanine(966)-N(2))-methyltransferase RsmD [Campylobacter bilis]MCC8278194.1 16S rRNA (guanine(966)-N(2))-methyltransferase RsmD [Campylobacter bilis]MCC8299698.1 16S rRNA (guanine(966)-N(2))-methyltransferase RsmD [Campylobacter bilis]MCC8301103.1 16S rRNA (guanine(966)-N(2))-methyltransferase RsmD [Campylobac
MDKTLKNTKDFFNKNNKINSMLKKQEIKTPKQNIKKAKESKLYVRIESGKHKGKKLLLPNLTTTRSTKSIVKNCVFNVIRQDLKDKIFIEAFGGSALMAAEALSNYALKAYAIELDLQAYKVALKNAKNIDTNLEVIHANTFEILPKLLENSKNEIILYLDPPFHIRENFSDIYEKIYKFLNNLNLNTVKFIILEHHFIINTPAKIQNFQKIKEKKFGSTSLSFYII